MHALELFDLDSRAITTVQLRLLLWPCLDGNVSAQCFGKNLRFASSAIFDGNVSLRVLCFWKAFEIAFLTLYLRKLLWLSSTLTSVFDPLWMVISLWTLTVLKSILTNTTLMKMFDFIFRVEASLLFDSGPLHEQLWGKKESNDPLRRFFTWIIS